MLVFEYKLRGEEWQLKAIDEAMRTVAFIRNKCLRYWQDNWGVSNNDLQKLCAKLASEFEWAKKLNSQARQTAADRAWNAISRFYKNCREKKPGNKGYPKFKKYFLVRSVEYKTTGWKLSDDRMYLTLTDGFKIGQLKLVGRSNKSENIRGIHFYTTQQIKRVRIVRRSDGYYAQFCIDLERQPEPIVKTGKHIGIDLGLEKFLTDSEGNTVDNPRFYRKAERRIRRANKRLHRRNLHGKNRAKAKKKLGREYLKVQRQRKDFAIKTARALCKSADLIVLEDLKVSKMATNTKLAKSIYDAAWSEFRNWLEYFGKIFCTEIIAVAPHYTSQDCSKCGTKVKKSLSTRTHRCNQCNTVLDRDHNAAINILAKGLKKNTDGQSGINDLGEMTTTLSGKPKQSKSTRRASKSKQ